MWRKWYHFISVNWYKTVLLILNNVRKQRKTNSTNHSHPENLHNKSKRRSWRLLSFDNSHLACSAASLAKRVATIRPFEMKRDDKYYVNQKITFDSHAWQICSNGKCQRKGVDESSTLAFCVSDTRICIHIRNWIWRKYFQSGGEEKKKKMCLVVAGKKRDVFFFFIFELLWRNIWGKMKYMQS